MNLSFFFLLFLKFFIPISSFPSSSPASSSSTSSSHSHSNEQIDAISTSSKFRRNDDSKLKFSEEINLLAADVITKEEIPVETVLLNDQRIDQLNSINGLVFDPPILEYGSIPVCIPSVSVFTLTNSLNYEFDLISILSDNSQFYPVLFQPQIVYPKESIQIQILYLPFYAQVSKATLTLSTSIGNFPYPVSAAQAYNSYHLHPFIGYRIASGIPFQQPISLFNPHDQPLHIREIYTTEEFLSLEGILPMEFDENNNPLSNQWILEPGVERNIISLAMGSIIPGSYTGYVHIKTNYENIVIPVELNVMDGGLHVTPQNINFGILTNIHDVSVVNVTLFNSGNKPIEILEMLPATPDSNLQIITSSSSSGSSGSLSTSEGEKTKGMTMILMNNTEATIAQLVYKASIASGKISNKIIIITNHSNPALAIVEIPYDVSCVHGGIGYEFNQALFLLPVRNISNKHIVIPAVTATGGGGTVRGYSTEVRMTKGKLPTDGGGASAHMINGYNSELLDIRNLTLTNYFSITLQILHLHSVTCPDVVSLQSPTSNSEVLVADSLQSYSPITVQFNKLIAQEMLRTKDSLPHQCWLDIHTNFSTVRLPLVVIDGNVEMKPIGEIVTHVDDRSANQTKGKMKNVVNSDILSIRIPYISISNPRPIEIQFTNVNPVRVPISIHSSTSNMTLCWKSMDGTGTSSSDPSGYQAHDYLTGYHQHHFHSNHQPSTSYLLNSIDNLCYRYVNSTSRSGATPTNGNDTSTYFIKSEQSVIVTIFFENLEIGSNKKTEIHFMTPYQMKILNIFYHGIPGELIHSYYSDQTTLTMGRSSVIDIFTYSSFHETIQIDLITSSSRLLPVVMHTPSENETLTENQTFQTNQSSDLGFLTAHIVSPYLECLVPYSRLRKINLWGCIIVLFEEWLTSIHHHSSYHPSSSTSPAPTPPHGPIDPLAPATTTPPSIRPIVITDEEYGLYTKMLDLLRPIEGDILSGRYDVAMQQIYDFRLKWLKYFPHGIPIPEFNVMFKSTVTSSLFTVTNIHIQIPLSKSSFYSNFITTPITYSQVIFIYFVIMNPYDVTLEVTLADDHLPQTSFTEYDLEKIPNLDHLTTPPQDDQNDDLGSLPHHQQREKRRREIYSFEYPEKISPYSHLPHSIGGSRDLKKIMSMPSELRRLQRVQRISTSLSSIASDDFLETNEILEEGQEDDFFLMKSLITIPRYFTNIAAAGGVNHHPPFSKFSSTSTHILLPHTKQLFGPIAFLPISADQDPHHPQYHQNSFSMDRYYNLSLYIHNNYTGIEKVDVICPVSKILLSVSDVKLNSLESPELEPTLPPPSSSSSSSLSSSTELFESRPGLITLSSLHSFSLPISPDQPHSSLFHLTPFSISEAITVMANQEMFTIQIYLNNTSRVQTVVDQILVNGKYDICRGEVITTDQHYQQNLFPIFPGGGVGGGAVVLTSSNICHHLPLTLSPNQLQLLNLTLRVNCLYLSDHFTLSFLSNLYSSSRNIFLLHCSVYVTMTTSLTNICRMRNFSMDSAPKLNYFLKFVGFLVLSFLTFQTHQLSGFLNKFVFDEEERKEQKKNKSNNNSSSKHNNKRSSQSLDSHPGSAYITTTPPHPSSVEAFPYLRKGIHLDDIFPIIDPSTSQFEAIDSLKSKRISSYYSPSPRQHTLLKTASSSASSSTHEEIVVLEDIEKNIRNPIIILSSSFESSSAAPSPPPPSLPPPPSSPSSPLPPPLAPLPLTPLEMETSTTLVKKNEQEEISLISKDPENLSDAPPLNTSPQSPATLPVAEEENSPTDTILPAAPLASVETTTQKPPKVPKTKKNGISKAQKSKGGDGVISKPSSSLDDHSAREVPRDAETLLDSSSIVTGTPSPISVDQDEPPIASSDVRPEKESSHPAQSDLSEEFRALDHLGSDALRASVIHSVSPAVVISSSPVGQNSREDSSKTLGVLDQDPTIVYPPNSFDTYESHEMWEHVETPLTTSPEPSVVPVPPPSLSPSRSISSSINGIENMVAEILDSETAPEPGDPLILKSESTDSSGILPNPSYDDWQYEKTKSLDRAPTPPPGFAGALGTYEYFPYYQDHSSPSQDSFQVPLDPSYLRHGENKRSPSHGAIGENASFMTPPRGLPSTPSTSSPSHQTYPQFLSLPAPALSSHDLLGDDAEWEAMLTMPFEDMSGQMSHLSHLTGLSGQNSVSGLRTGSSNNDSFRSSQHHQYGSFGLTQSPLPNRVNNQIQQSHQPNYRTPASPNFSYDGRAVSQNSPGVHYPQPGSEVAYGGGSMSYHSYPSVPTHPSPNRSFQADYQQRQYNPRRSAMSQSYDGTEFNGLGVHPNQIYEMDRRNLNQSGGVYQGGSLYGAPDRYSQQQQQQATAGSYQAYGMTQHHSFPYSQSDIGLFGSHGMSYQSPNHEGRSRDSQGPGGGGAPGLSPNGGYYQSGGSGQPNPYPQRDNNNNNRHNNQQ